MSGDPYSARVRELFAKPLHAGRLAGELHTSIDDQGVRIGLYAEVAGGVIRTLRFQARACPHVIAATEAFCADFEGQDASGLLEFSAAGLMQSLAVPLEKSGRILVLEDAVRSLGRVVRDASHPGN